ncbi:MAG: tetratricopeptide repeat protein [Bacteroidales bacterium]|nr:tetratricopeptide repeat protein [Bacteroidales bacterium]
MANKKDIQEDEKRLENVENALSKTELWIEEHQKLIYGIIAAVIIIAGIIWGLKALNDKKNANASKEIFTAQKYFEKESYEAALTGDGNYLGFTEVYDQYKSTKTGKLAAYYAGISNMKLGNYNEAIDYLKKFTTKDEILAPMALGAIGDCYMELDDLNNAAANYMNAANKSKNNFTGPMFLSKAGLTYEILGEYAKALNCYKTLKADYPMSNEAFEISKNIANMEAKLK